MDERPAGHEPMTEQQILAATVGERRVHDGPVHLAEYDPSWPKRFDREAERIAAALGERELMIEHVGRHRCPASPPSRPSTSCWS